MAKKSRLRKDAELLPCYLLPVHFWLIGRRSGSFHAEVRTGTIPCHFDWMLPDANWLVRSQRNPTELGGSHEPQIRAGLRSSFFHNRPNQLRRVSGVSKSSRDKISGSKRQTEKCSLHPLSALVRIKKRQSVNCNESWMFVLDATSDD